VPEGQRRHALVDARERGASVERQAQPVDLDLGSRPVEDQLKPDTLPLKVTDI
jgi:hypothetical protein